jgi:multiple sugar transport system substrate-binding protein
MKKALISLVILLATAALLFAGGQTTMQPEMEPAGAAEKTPIEQYSLGFAFPTEKIELSYWHVLGTRPGFDELANEIAAAYTAIHPNVSITVRAIPNAQQRAIFSAAFESNTAGDIVWVEAQVGLMAKALLPAPAWAETLMEELFTPYVLSLSKVKDRYYGWSGAEVDAGQMLYYRSDLFREAGLNPDDPPEFTTELLDAAQKLTKMEGGQMSQAGIALRYAGGHQGIGDKFSKYAAAWVDTSKNFYYNADFTDVIFDDRGWIEAGQFFHDLVFNYKVTNTTLPTPIQAFGLGLAAMTNRESFFAGWMKENAPDAEYGIAPLASGKAPHGGYRTGAMPWLALNCVTVDSKNPDVAWDFNMYLVNEENELRIAKNNGGMSRLKSAQDDPYFRDLPYFEVFQTMTNERPIVRNVYLDPNTLQAELEAKLGEAAVDLLTNDKADADALMKGMAEYGRKRLREIGVR